MSTFQIPLLPQAQQVTVTLSGVTYQMTFQYRNAPDYGWQMDIADQYGNPLVCGIPLVLGVNLLQQYGYLGFSGQLYVVRVDGSTAAPGYADLGGNAQLWYTTP